MSKRRRKIKSRFKFVNNLLEGVGFVVRMAGKILPLVIFAALIFVLFTGVKKILYADPALNVKSVRLFPADSLTVSQKQLIESKLLGKNIVILNLKKYAALLEKEPEVLKVRLQKVLPESVYAYVEKRRPIALVQLRPGGTYGISAQDGMIMSTHNERDQSLVLIKAYASKAATPNMGSFVKVPGFEQAVQFIIRFWDQPISKKESIAELSLDPHGSLSMVLEGGPLVKLGKKPVDEVQVLSKLIPILENAERADIDYIDLQFNPIAVKKKSDKR